MARVLYILLAILCFGVMVAIHEFGHFLTAKLLKVRVNEFSVGMGPALWSKEKGETKYSLRALPIGGYCAMEGEDEDTGDPHAFSVQPWWKRVIILCAGAAMNFLLGLVIVVLLYSGVSMARQPVITEFMDGFPLEGEQGLMVGDRILAIDGHRILMYSDVQTFLARNDGSGMDITVLRDGEKVRLRDLPLVPREYVYEGETVTMFGLIFGQAEELGFFGRLRQGAAQAVDFVRLVWVSLGDLLGGRARLRDMSGVIGIVDAVGSVGAASQTVADGLMSVFYFVAFISVNLAVMNLLPVPALDGGRIFFILVNALVYLVSRRRIPAKYEGYVHTAGFVLLLALMAVIAFQDVWKIVAS